MKKLLAIIFILVLVLSLVGCVDTSKDNSGKTDKTAATTPNTATSQTQKTPEIINPTDVEIPDSYDEQWALLYKVFVPIAGEKVERDWKTVDAFINTAGYKCIVDEGTFSIIDPYREGSYIDGMLTNENGYIEICDIYYNIQIAEKNYKSGADWYKNTRYLIEVDEISQTSTEVASLSKVVEYIRGTEK